MADASDDSAALPLLATAADDEEGDDDDEAPVPSLLPSLVVEEEGMNDKLPAKVNSGCACRIAEEQLLPSINDENPLSQSVSPHRMRLFTPLIQAMMLGVVRICASGETSALSATMPALW